MLLLKELENSALRVLKVMEIFRHDDGRNISKCLRSVTFAKIWIIGILGVYSQLADDKSLQGEELFDSLPVYTHGFVSLLDTIQEFQWSSDDELSSLKQQEQSTTSESIVRRLNEVYDGFWPNYNPAPFFYHGHRYIRIDNERSEAEVSKYLDDDKELKPSFYEEVISYYANVNLDEIDDLITDDPLPVRSDRQEADVGRMRRALRSIDEEASPLFLKKTTRDRWKVQSFKQLWETLEPLYEKLEALGESTAEVQVVNKEIQVYEVAWKMVHAMLNIPFERTVWEEEQHWQTKRSKDRQNAANEEVISDDGSEDSWHIANDITLDDEDSNNI